MRNMLRTARNQLRPCAVLAACVSLAACGAPPADDDASELKNFLAGAKVDAYDLDSLNASFARIAVRAHGYAASGVDDPSGETWSPVAVRRGSRLDPADVSPWLDAGDIDDSGHFSPEALVDGASLGWPEPPAGIDDIEQAPERAERLAGALAHLARREIAIEWAPRSERGVVLGDDGTATVSPRLLWLVPLDEEDGAALAMPGESPPAGAGKAGPPATRPASAQPVDNHPKPPRERSSSGGCDACDINVCDSSDFGSNSSCAVPARAPRNAGGVLGFGLLLAALLLRRRTRAGATLLGLALIWLSTTPSAFAQSAEAKSHYDEATRHMARKAWADAVRALELAVRLEASARNLEALATAARKANDFPKAIRTLERMLAEHGADMPAAQKKKANDAIAEMRPVLAFVEVRVTPPGAALLVDGDPVPPGAASQPVPLSPGKHTISAQQPGYATASQNVDVASGSKDTVVELHLVPDKGHVTVRAGHPQASIAIDGRPMGSGTWAGLLPPGRHVVDVAVPGLPPQAVSIDVYAGRTTDVPIYLPRPGPMEQAPPPRPPEPTGPPQLGPYGLLGGSVAYALVLPASFHIRAGDHPGGSASGRVGYRFARNVAVELMAEYGRIGAEGSLEQFNGVDADGDGEVTSDEGTTDERAASYHRQWFRLGPALKIMSSGRQHRAVGALGIGFVYESMKLDHADLVWDPATNAATKVGTYHHEYAGPDIYLVLEGGYELELKGFLFDVLLELSPQSTGGIAGEPYESSVQLHLGLHLRAGYASW